MYYIPYQQECIIISKVKVLVLRPIQQLMYYHITQIPVSLLFESKLYSVITGAIVDSSSNVKNLTTVMKKFCGLIQ